MHPFIQSLRLTVALCLLFVVGYVLVLWGFAQVAAPNGGKPETVSLRGRRVGTALVGQTFSDDIHFWSRPSCAGSGYDAMRSGGSNRAATDSAYLAEVEQRTKHFLAHHPYLQRRDIPAEMVTASGSGLDPDISPAAAYAQVRRVAQARRLSERAVRALVSQHVEPPLFGLFGPPRVNVLLLNVDLERKYPIYK